MEGTSLDIKTDILEQLKAVIPQAFSEEKLDIDRLKNILGDLVNTDGERYGLSWAGKSEAYKVIQTTTKATLQPKPDESIDWDNAENVFIEGENLEVLKALQKSYYGKIKMIYIDPPYNTGSDSFIYPDKFSETKEEYLKRIGEKSEDGSLMKEGLFRKNSKENGQYHSNWLNMMLPRLFLARNLLKEDGVIFVSIDNNEQSNLKLLMDEVFGEENFIEIFSWVKTSTPPGLSKKTRKTIEYILCYERNKSEQKYKGEMLDGGDQPLLNSGNKKRIIKIPKNKVYFKNDGIYEIGEYDRIFLHNKIIVSNGYPDKDLEIEGEFKWTQETVNSEISNGTTFIIKSDKLAIRFIRQEEGYKAPTNLLKEKYTIPVINKKNNNVGTNEEGSSEVSEMLGGNYFDFPKPVSLIKHLIGFCTDENDIILDFFAGSGTTAQAVMELNEQDGGNRKYICVQLPEQTDENSEAYKAGYKTIADISKARIQKVIEKIEAERNGSIQYEKTQNLGFRKYTLTESNFKIWRGDFIENEQDLLNQMQLFETPEKEGSTTENMLWELMIKSGLPLTEKVETVKVSNTAKVYYARNKSLAFVLDEYNESVQQELLNTKPKSVLCLDSLFNQNDNLKTNAQLKLEDNGISFKTI